MKRQKYTYIPKDEIESINTWSGKNIPQDKILDGAYVRGKVKYGWGGKMADGGEVKEYTKEEAVNLVKESGKKRMTFYYNVRGWGVSFTLKPTSATPSGKLMGFPSSVSIYSDGRITGKNLTYGDGGMMANGGEVEIITNFIGNKDDADDFIKEYTTLTKGKFSKHRTNADDSWRIEGIVTKEAIEKYNLDRDFMIVRDYADGGDTNVTNEDVYDYGEILSSEFSRKIKDVSYYYYTIEYNGKVYEIEVSDDGISQEVEFPKSKARLYGNSGMMANGGQTDEELYTAMTEMGYDYGDFGTRNFDDSGFSEMAINLGYRWDDEKELWFNTDDDELDYPKLANGGETDMHIKSVEEQAQEVIGNRFYQLNQQEREDVINNLIKEGIIYPRVTYTQFEEENFEYAGGGGVAAASYKVVYQMVGSKDKKEKLFTDKAKAELFVETMEEDEDVKSVKMEEVKGEKTAKASKTPTINLFGAAKKAPATSSSKKSRPQVEVDEIAEDIARHDELKAIIDNAKAELEVVDGRIEEVALEKYLQMYEDTRRNPPNFDLVAGGNSLIFIVMDKYIKVTPEKRALLEQYGEGLVEVVNTYEFNNAIIEKTVRGNKTVGDIISKLIMDSTEIPEEDKANLITVKETMRVPKGTIDRLGEYDNIPEVFTLIEPITALK